MVRLRSVSWVFTAQVASLALSFPMSVLLARVLGPAGKGQLSLAQLVTTLGMTIFSLGLNSAGQYLAARREVSSRPVLIMAVAIALAVELIGLPALILLAPAVRESLDALHLWPLVLGMLALAPGLVGGFAVAYLNGLGEIRTVSLINTLGLALQLAVYVALAVTRLLTPLSAILAWASIVTASTVLTVRLALAHGTSGSRSVRYFARHGISYGLMTWIAAGLSLLVLRVDMLMLAGFKGTASVGVYSIAVTFAELLFYVPTAVSTVLLPKVASEGESARELSCRLTRMLWPATALLGIVIAVVAGLLIVPVYGEEFGPAIGALWLLVPGTCFSAASGAIWPYFAGTGRPRESVFANLSNLLANVALNAVLIPPLGILGASIASAISYGLASAILIGRFSHIEGVALRTLLVPRLDDVAGVFAAVKSMLMRNSAIGPDTEAV